MTAITEQEFEAAIAKITADYADHYGIAKVIASGLGLRDYDEICTAAGENCASLGCELNTVELVEMFEASLEGILSA